MSLFFASFRNHLSPTATVVSHTSAIFDTRTCTSTHPQVVTNHEEGGFTSHMRTELFPNIRSTNRRDRTSKKELISFLHSTLSQSRPYTIFTFKLHPSV